MKFSQTLFTAVVGFAAFAAAAPPTASTGSATAARSGAQLARAPSKAGKPAEGTVTKTDANSVVNPGRHTALKAQRGQGHSTGSHKHSGHSTKRQGQHAHGKPKESVVSAGARPANPAVHKPLAKPALNARDYMDEIELFVRALEEELEARSYEEELDVREYFEDELEARDVEDELVTRDVETELLVREFEDKLAERGLSFSYDQLELRGNGQHHCPECKKSVNSRCIKKGHVVVCDKHDDSYHMPGKECVQCKGDAERAAKAEKKK